MVEVVDAAFVEVALALWPWYGPCGVQGFLADRAALVVVGGLRVDDGGVGVLSATLVDA